MGNWNEREQDWRGGRGWRDRDDRETGSNQDYRQNGYGENRSWTASETDRVGRDYGDGGARYGRDDYRGDQRRYGQGSGDYDRGRYGEDRYGNQNYGSQSSGRGQGYGVEWSDRDSYDSRRHDDDYRSSGYGRRDDYGRQTSRDDYGRGNYGQGRGTGFGDPNPYVQAATDGETQGAHRGRGPKDYKRSDDRIREDVNDRLTDDAHIDASGIQVSVKDGEVTLTGTVENRFAKRHAEDLAERISGAKHVQNNLRVQDSRWDQGQADTTSAGTTRGGSTFS